MPVAVVVCESGVWAPGVPVDEGVFWDWSARVDCDEEREKVLEKGAPRWVSFSSAECQCPVELPLPAATTYSW